jgi:hypothetical protein
MKLHNKKPKFSPLHVEVGCYYLQAGFLKTGLKTGFQTGFWKPVLGDKPVCNPINILRNPMEFPRGWWWWYQKILNID